MAFYDRNKHQWVHSKTEEYTRGRSGFEARIMDELDENNITYLYEPARLAYTIPATYTPDFALTKQCIIIEVKGRFVTADRQKMKKITSLYPDLDIRMLFSSFKTKISAKSKTTYGKWCTDQGILYAEQSIPIEWLKHKPTKAAKKAFEDYLNNQYNLVI